MKTFFKVIWSLVKGVLYAYIPRLVANKVGGNLGPVLYLLYWSISGWLWSISLSSALQLSAIGRLLSKEEGEEEKNKQAKETGKTILYSCLERIPLGIAGWVVLYSVLFN
jgi:hypothetical protein